MAAVYPARLDGKSAPVAASTAASAALRVSANRRDALLLALAGLHAAALLLRPSMLIVAIGLWWNANTISHNFIHRPMFASRAGRAAFSCGLSLLLGFPQSLWRARHLAHHAGRKPQITWNAQMIAETLMVAALWCTLAAVKPMFMFSVWLPGWLLGLALCRVHGRYEHARGAVSHYGRIYNLLFFNDGYHAEHHAHPGMHWSRLPQHKIKDAATSNWPAVLRWMEDVKTITPCAALCALERIVRRSPRLQRFVLDRHERAFRKLLNDLRATRAIAVEDIKTIGVIGGGLFPRTAMVLARVCPNARLSLIDLDSAHLEMARETLGDSVDYVCERFEAGNAQTPADSQAFDAIVIPLAYVGNREAIYRHPPARAVFVHDWIWRRRGRSASAVVSLLLLKRLNVVVKSKER